MAINRYTGIGNLTRDAELRRTNSGTAVLNFGIAINERRKNGQTGEWEDAPVYIDCTIFGSRAEKLADYLVKGVKVGIEGRLRWSSWEKDGQRRSKIDVIVDELEFMSQRQQGGGYSSGYDDRHQQIAREQAQYVEATVYDDDLPF